MSGFLQELSHYDWKIPSAYMANPNPFYDLAWAELAVDGSQCSKEDDNDFITLGSGVQEPTKVDVFFRQPLDHNGAWVADRSEIGQTEAILYPSPSAAQLPELSEGDIGIGNLSDAVDIGFRGMSVALALLRHATGPTTCEGMFIKRGSLRPFKKSSFSLQSMNECTNSANVTKDEATIVFPPRQASYNTVQKVLRGFLGLDKMYDIMCKMDDKMCKMDDMLTHIYQHGLTKADLHEIGVVIDARRGIFLPPNRIVNIVSSSAFVHVKDILGKQAPLLVKQ